MAEQDQFSVEKVSTYSMEELEQYYSAHVKLAKELEALRVSYNDQAREALQRQDLGSGQYFSDLRDVAKDRSAEEYRKGLACKVEVDLRTRTEG